jgi:TonB family protein
MKPVIPTRRSKHRNVRRTLFGYFVLVSLLLHALVITLWRGEPPAGPVGRSTFQVTLLARHGDVPDKSGTETDQVKTSDSTVSAKGSVASSEQSALVEDKTENPQSMLQIGAALQPVVQTANGIKRPAHRAQAGARTAPAKGAEAARRVRVTEFYQATERGNTGITSGSKSDGQHELTSAAKYQRVRAELFKALLPYFEYPSTARRRGWQGRVKVGLLVEADGDLSGVHLVESSGYASLDEAAVKNVIELGNVPGATQWLNGRELDVILPVNYRLQDR